MPTLVAGRSVPAGFELRSLAAICLACALVSAGRGAPGGEVRAVWVTRWDFRTASHVRRAVRGAAALELNRIYFQVRGRADAFYRSSLEPWGEELGGRDPGFDPLALALAEAKAHGLELHAWINVLCGWKGNAPPRNRSHIYYTRPEWFVYHLGTGRKRLDAHYVMINPCLPEVRRYLAAVTDDIVRRYPLDGLHLDYVRFFGIDPKRPLSAPYDNRTLAIFRKETGGFPSKFPEKWNEFRTRAVNETVRLLSRTARRARPGIVVSAAVIRDFDRGRRLFFQDAPSWKASGWVDEVVPMNYDRSYDGFVFHASLASKRLGPRSVIAGIGAYQLKDPRELERRIDAVRRLGLRGFSIFAFADLYPTPSHASRSGPQAEALRRKFRAVLRSAAQARTGRADLRGESPGP